MAFAKIAAVGSMVQDATYRPGQTVSQVLNAYGIRYNASTVVTINGYQARLNTELPDTDGVVNITLSSNVKGGAEFDVRVTVSGGTTRQVRLVPGSTVADALRAAQTELPRGGSVNIDGAPANANTVLTGIERIIVVSASVKGGN